MGLGNPTLFNGDVEIHAAEHGPIAQIEILNSPNHNEFHPGKEFSTTLRWDKLISQLTNYSACNIFSISFRKLVMSFLWLLRLLAQDGLPASPDHGILDLVRGSGLV